MNLNSVSKSSFILHCFSTIKRKHHYQYQFCWLIVIFILFFNVFFFTSGFSFAYRLVQK